MEQNEIEKAAEEAIETFKQLYSATDAEISAFKVGLDAGLSLAKQQEGEGWISVETRLPEFDKKVLVWGEQKGMNPQMGGAYACITKRQDLSKTSVARDARRMQDENQFTNMNCVTHWMPLPKKPTSNTP